MGLEWIGQDPIKIRIKWNKKKNCLKKEGSSDLTDQVIQMVWNLLVCRQFVRRFDGFQTSLLEYLVIFFPFAIESAWFKYQAIHLTVEFWVHSRTSLKYFLSVSCGCLNVNSFYHLKSGSRLNICLKRIPRLSSLIKLSVDFAYTILH